jgi:CRISPR-associated endonuclease/helicase Cas3
VATAIFHGNGVVRLNRFLSRQECYESKDDPGPTSIALKRLTTHISNTHYKNTESETIMDYKQLWAKSEPYHPLWCHLLDIAAVCKALMVRFGGIDPLPEAWVLYIVALHDIGKADVHFQNKNEEEAERLKAYGFCLPDEVTRFRHEARSADWMLESLRDAGWDFAAADVVSKATRGHHGNFLAGKAPDEDYCEQEYPKRMAIWAPLRQLLADLVRHVLNVQAFKLDRFESASAAGIKLTGLIVLSDWIASNNDVFRYDKLPREADTDDYYAAAVNEGRLAVQRLALDIGTDQIAGSCPVPFKTIFPKIGEPRPSQRTLESLCLAGLPPGLLIVEAPMGEGKTEGAFYVAEHWRRTAGRSGTYFALPTMATSNQMHGRYKEFLANRHPELPVPRLIHGMAWLVDKDTPESPPQIGDRGPAGLEERATSLEWFRNSKRALIAPEGVGTIDQILRGALNVKHGFLRFLGLSSRVLIMDEIHAYDEFMTTLIERVLEWCKALQIPVILLSATLSLRQKTRLVAAYGGTLPIIIRDEEEDPYPLVTFTGLNGETKVHKVQSSGSPRKVHMACHVGVLGDSDAVADLAVESVKKGGCICVFANTVRSAQAIFEAVKRRRARGCRIILYHARFRAEKREAIEKQVMRAFGRGEGHKRPRRAVLVATQVAEQSLDVDFDAMISELAPIDLLLQRSGRLHRHDRVRPTGLEEPTLQILLPAPGEFKDFGGTGWVYEHEALLRTIALLYIKNEIELPTDFRPLVEGCYSDRMIDPCIVPQDVLDIAQQVRIKAEEDQANKARTHLIPEPDPSDFLLALAPRAKMEGEEGEGASYFRPQTRLGGDTFQALVLHDPALVALTRSDQPPRRAVLRKLFLQKVSLQNWWLLGVKPDHGYELMRPTGSWLRNHVVIPVVNGQWRGIAKNGEIVTLKDDRDLGLTLVKEEAFDGDV